MSNLKNGNLVLGILSLMLISCSAALREPSVDQWPELQFSVDGKVDIEFRVPPGKAKKELFETQFISTVPDPTQSMLFANYDPGRWSNRGLLLTSIAATIFRLEPNSSPGISLTSEDIKNDLYLARPDASKQFDVSEEYTFNNRQWLRINLISGYRRGISYATIVGDHYAFVLTMTIFGEDSAKTSLYQTRHKTLTQIIETTRIWPE